MFVKAANPVPDDQTITVVFLPDRHHTYCFRPKQAPRSFQADNPAGRGYCCARKAQKRICQGDAFPERCAGGNRRPEQAPAVGRTTPPPPRKRERISSLAGTRGFFTAHPCFRQPILRIRPFNPDLQHRPRPAHLSVVLHSLQAAQPYQPFITLFGFL